MRGSVRDIDVPGGWTEQEIDLDPHRLLRLVLPADPDQFLDWLAAEPADATARSAHNPYWAKLWPAAVVMARQIVGHRWPAGVSAVEFGCGVGLVGLAAFSAGLQVTLTDVIPLALRTAVENAERNGFATTDSALAHSRLVQARELNWLALESFQPQMTFQVGLAAEVVYDRALHDPLLDAIQHVVAPDGVTWIADSGRSVAEDFVDAATRRGFEVARLDQHGQPLAAPRLGQYQLFVLRRRPQEGGNG